MTLTGTKIELYGMIVKEICDRTGFIPYAVTFDLDGIKLQGNYDVDVVNALFILNFDEVDERVNNNVIFTTFKKGFIEITLTREEEQE